MKKGKLKEQNQRPSREDSQQEFQYGIQEEPAFQESEENVDPNCTKRWTRGGWNSTGERRELCIALIEQGWEEDGPKGSVFYIPCDSMQKQKCFCTYGPDSMCYHLRRRIFSWAKETGLAMGKMQGFCRLPFWKITSALNPPHPTIIHFAIAGL